MIVKLKGNIENFDENFIDLDVNGVVYRVLMSNKNISKLGAVGSYVTIFNKTASAYSANDYLIEAYKSGATLFFRVTFNEDKGPNPNFDEAVTATTTSTAQQNRPNNTNAVNVPAPTFNTTNGL